MDPLVEEFPRNDSIWRPLAVVPREPARAGYNDLPPGKAFPPIVFDDFDFWLAVKGRSKIEVLGQTRRLDARPCPLLPPLLPALHRVAPDTDCRIVYCHFDIAYQGQILRDARP